MKKIFFLLLFFSTAVQAWTDIDIISVIDGDSIKVSVRSLFPPLNRMSIRLRGVDTPELHTPKCAKERELAITAKKFLEGEISKAKVIDFRDLNWDKYGGRVLSTVYIDGVDISSKLIENGYAIKYFGDRKTHNWCQ